VSDTKDSNYEVGFGKPPKHTQFHKGRSGNPKGRARGSRNASTLLDEALRERVIVAENGRRRKVTKLEVVLTQLVNKAAQGDHSATRLLLEWTERLQLTDRAGKPLTLVQLLEAIEGISDEDEQ
jgi:Family of unknown function (DUF5681)